MGEKKGWLRVISPDVLAAALYVFCVPINFPFNLVGNIG